VHTEQMLGWATKLLPQARADYARGLLAELPMLPPDERRGWLIGGVWFVLREAVIFNAPYLAGLAIGDVVLVAVDRSPSDVANQASLLVLLLTAGALGLARPRSAWLTGAVVGIVLTLTHAAYQAFGLPLPYPMSPSGWTGVLTLLLLLVPAWGAAHLGAATRRGLQHRS
jgi:hypothetical protein